MGIGKIIKAGIVVGGLWYMFSQMPSCSTQKSILQPMQSAAALEQKVSAEDGSPKGHPTDPSSGPVVPENRRNNADGGMPRYCEGIGADYTTMTPVRFSKSLETISGNIGSSMKANMGQLKKVKEAYSEERIADSRIVKSSYARMRFADENLPSFVSDRYKRYELKKMGAGDQGNTGLEYRRLEAMARLYAASEKALDKLAIASKIFAENTDTKGFRLSETALDMLNQGGNDEAAYQIIDYMCGGPSPEGMGWQNMGSLNRIRDDYIKAQRRAGNITDISNIILEAEGLAEKMRKGDFSEDYLKKAAEIESKVEKYRISPR